MTNEDLGYDDFFEENKVKQGYGDFDVARVISEHKGLYIVKNISGEFQSRVRGKQMFNARSRYDYPVVGDWVVITQLNDNQAAIESILKRKTIISRIVEDRSKQDGSKNVQTISANIDAAFIVQSVDRDYNLNRFERYILISENGGVEPILVLNKIDLISESELDSIKSEIATRFGDVRTIFASTMNESSVKNLNGVLEKGKTYCFLGSSGVGKSSMINVLTKGESIKVAQIGEHSKRGRHTTTGRQMYFMDGGSILIDNPGIREVGVHGDIDNTKCFSDLDPRTDMCKFSNCTHTHEPGCVIAKMIEDGDIDREKYSNYISLKKEAEYYELSDYEKRQKDKNFGRMIKRAMKNMNK